MPLLSGSDLFTSDMSLCVAFLVDFYEVFFYSVDMVHMSEAWGHISCSFWCHHLDI